MALREKIGTLRGQFEAIKQNPYRFGKVKKLLGRGANRDPFINRYLEPMGQQEVGQPTEAEWVGVQPDKMLDEKLSLGDQVAFCDRLSEIADVTSFISHDSSERTDEAKRALGTSQAFGKLRNMLSGIPPEGMKQGETAQGFVLRRIKELSDELRAAGQWGGNSELITAGDYTDTHAKGELYQFIRMSKALDFMKATPDTASTVARDWKAHMEDKDKPSIFGSISYGDLAIPQ